MTEIEVAFRSVERRVGDVRAHPQIDAARRSRNAWIMHRGTAVVGQIQSAVGDKRCVGSHSKRKRLTFSTPSRLTQARGYAGGIAAVSEPARSGERRGNPRVAGGGRVGRGGVGWTHVQVAGGKTTAVQYCDTGLPAESGVQDREEHLVESFTAKIGILWIQETKRREDRILPRPTFQAMVFSV